MLSYPVDIPSDHLYVRFFFVWANGQMLPLQATRIYSYSYFSKIYFDRYCSMATLCSSFPTEKWSRILSSQPLSLADIENDSWVEESVIATIFPYFDIAWTYFSGFLLHCWRRTISPKIVAALIFANLLETHSL